MVASIPSQTTVFFFFKEPKATKVIRVELKKEGKKWRPITFVDIAFDSMLSKVPRFVYNLLTGKESINAITVEYLFNLSICDEIPMSNLVHIKKYINVDTINGRQ